MEIDTENLIIRATQMICFGVSVNEIHDMLIAECCNEDLAFLIWSAARIQARAHVPDISFINC